MVKGNCTRRRFLKTIGLGFAASVLSETAGITRAATSKRPNILYIMSDDHAAHAISAYGSRLAKVAPTPNIDRLANEGILFENCFCTNSICVPSRATILTGQYSQTNGVLDLGGKLEPEKQTLPRLMKQAGYETAMIGKWHLKTEPTFDYYCVLPGQGSYFNPILRESGGQWPNNEKRFTQYDSCHSSDVITDQSLKWLKSRDRSKPFFLMHHFKAPHDNFENAERYDWLFNDVYIPEPESLWNPGRHGSEATKGMGTSIGKRNKRRNMGMHMFVDPSLPDEQYKRTAFQRYLKKYLRCVRGVDDNIGRLFAYLEQSGQMDNTIILYTSDQGMMLGEHDFIDKRWMYEESMRMPFLVRYPNMIKPGTRTDEIINNTDFAPTILALAGLETPDSMHGRSFVPLLKGRTPADWPQSTYYRYWMHMAHHDNPAHFGVRTKEYKLIFFYGLNYKKGGPKPTQPGWELYDMKNDPHETNNLYGNPRYTDVVKELKAELLRLRKKYNETDDRYPHIQKVIDDCWDT
ncbi:MAG: sulfatase [Sedimentisphaerales bacterium]|nr:sulfatase [Sedimentisphaerales bacterium]